MQTSLTSTTTPIRQLSLFSRSSSLNARGPSVRHPSGSPAARESSARLSAHLRGSILRTSPRPLALTAAAAPPPPPPLLPLQPFPLSPGASSVSDIPPLGEEDAAAADICDDSDERAAPRAQRQQGRRRITRAELESAVNALRTDNRTLQCTICLQREDLARLKDGLRETYEAVEKEGESITNHLMRRVAAVRRQKGRLEAQLHSEEELKLEQESRLVSLKVSSSNLARRLQREEEETLASLTAQLSALQQQRQQTEALLSAQASSLQQLQELVDGLSQHDEGTTATSTTTTTATATATGRRASVPQSVASDPHEMLYYLKNEVAVVEALQKEAFERGEKYLRERKELERRIVQAERERRSNRHSMEGIHQELTETTACATEMASAVEMAREVEFERFFHETSKNRSRALSTTSSVRSASNPKFVAHATENECFGGGDVVLHVLTASKKHS